MRESTAVYISRFRCENEDTARRLVNTLVVVGLYPELHGPRLAGQPWEVSAAAELVPEEGNLAELRDDMRAAADRAGAAFDGLDPER